MRDSGKMTKQTAREGLFMQMEMFTRVIGRMIRLKGMVNTLMQMGQNTTVIGKKTNSTVKVMRLGLMVLFIMATIKRDRKMEKVFSSGKMVALTEEIS